MRQVADFLEALNIKIGMAVRWLIVFMVLVQFGIVVLRYVFSVTFIAADESVLYMHSMVFMLAAAYTLAVDQHVRVDIFYARLSERGQGIINTLGHLLLLLPSLALIFYYSLPSTLASWAIFEGPISIGGIRAVFILKSLIPVFCLLLALQGVALILRDFSKCGSRP